MSRWSRWTKRIGGWLLLIGGFATLFEDLQKALKLLANSVAVCFPYLAIVTGLYLAFAPDSWAVAVRKKWRRRTGKYGELIYEIPFDKALNQQPGWHVYGGDAEMTNVDATDVGTSRGLRIQRAENDDGRCEYYLPSPYSGVRFIEFVGKDFAANAGFVLDVEVKPPQQETQSGRLWIRVGNATPKKHGTDWIVSIKPVSLSGGWQSILVDLDAICPYTFGTENWTWERLISIGCDGSMSMARITLRK